jgi:hypothetical protein
MAKAKRKYLTPEAHSDKMHEKEENSRHADVLKTQNDAFIKFMQNNDLENCCEFTDIVMYNLESYLLVQVFCMGSNKKLSETYGMKLFNLFAAINYNTLSSSESEFTGRIHIIVGATCVSFEQLLQMVVEHYITHDSRDLDPDLLFKVELVFSSELSEISPHPEISLIDRYRLYDLFGFRVYKYNHPEYDECTSIIHTSDWDTSVIRSSDACYHVTSMNDFSCVSPQ